MSKKSRRLDLPELVDSAGATSQASTYLRLRHALMIGAIEPGVAITIQDLADSLQVSATPVREALRQLSTEKALLTLENRRITVPEMTASRFEELINIRCTLEVYAAKRAMPYISKVDIDGLLQIDAAINKAVESNNWPLTVVLNQRFHSALYLANPDQVAMPMIESVWLQLGPFMRLAGRFQKDLYLVDRHKEAIEALHRGDESGLGMAIEADIRDAVGGLKPEIIGKILEDRELERNG
jgi:DNA-binding GntR family transcriptional regulator